MITRLLLIALLLIIPSIILGQNFSNPIIFSGVETMVFQNSVSPTPEYDGLRLSYIDWTNKTTNHYAGAGDTLATLGYGYRMLFQADLSALPDSAIIRSATLYMLKVDSDYFDDDDGFYVGLYRLLEGNLVFNEATWNNANTSVAWRTPGAADSLMRFNNSIFGAPIGPANIMNSNINELNTNWDRATRSGYPFGFGPDSLTVMPDTTNMADRMIAPSDFMHTVVDGAPLTSSFWIRFDITHSVRKWHDGSWPNYGGLIKAFAIHLSGSALLDGDDAALEGVYMTFANTKASIYTAPFLVVDYVLAQTEPEIEEEDEPCPECPEGGGDGGGSGGIRLGGRGRGLH